MSWMNGDFWLVCKGGAWRRGSWEFVSVRICKWLWRFWILFLSEQGASGDCWGVEQKGLQSFSAERLEPEHSGLFGVWRWIARERRRGENYNSQAGYALVSRELTRAWPINLAASKSRVDLMWRKARRWKWYDLTTRLTCLVKFRLLSRWTPSSLREVERGMTAPATLTWVLGMVRLRACVP